MKRKKVTYCFLLIVVVVITAFFAYTNKEVINLFNLIGKRFLKFLNITISVYCFVKICNYFINYNKNYEFRKYIGLPMLYFFMTTMFASIIGMIISGCFVGELNFDVIINRGADIDYKPVDLNNIFFAIIPTGIIKPFIDGNLVQVAGMALLVGTCFRMLKIFNFRGSLEFINNKIDNIFENFIAKYMYVGLYFVIVPLLSNNIKDFFGVVGFFLFTYVMLCVVYTAIIYTPIIFYVYKENTKLFIMNVAEVLLIAFTTASSLATLPKTMQLASKLNIDKKISNFMLPFGATVNMDGTALFLGMFISVVTMSCGMRLDVKQCFFIASIITIMSILTPGIPGATLIIVVSLLQILDLPLESLGILSCMSFFIEMVGTSLNVLGDIVGVSFINYSYNKKQ